MAEGEPLLWSFVGLGFGIYLFFKGFGWFWEKRLIENTPTSKIRSIAMGLVEILGEVVLAEKQILKSPLSNKDCVYYRFKIEEYRSSGDSIIWVTIKKGDKGINFYLKDDTGSVLIDPNKAKIEIPAKYSLETSKEKQIPSALQAYLTEQKVKTKALFGLNKMMRFTEYYIAPKDNLYIMGTAGDNPFVEEATGQKNEEDIMIQKGKGFYYMSDKQEKDILKSFKWKIIGGLWGGLGLIVVCLFIIFGYLKIL